MSAISLIRHCRDARIKLQVRGNRIHVEAPPGSLTPELRDAITAHKPELLALQSTRSRLRVVADGLGIPRAVVNELPLEELQATAEQTARAEGHTDGHGDSLAQTILTFYLCCLADRVSA